MEKSVAYGLQWIVALTGLALTGVVALAAPAPPLLLRDPTINRTSVVFSYAGDLWSVPREGGEARRLTAGPGIEQLPQFSPDGSQIAFTGEYDGNTDVFVVPADGGVPRRLTWHPEADMSVGSGFPDLMAGGFVTAPNAAIWNPNGQFDVENRGIAPDIEVQLDPAAVRQGHDPQLEKAVQVVMEELQKSPPVQPKRSAYPNYHAK